MGGEGSDPSGNYGSPSILMRIPKKFETTIYVKFQP